MTALLVCLLAILVAADGQRFEYTLQFAVNNGSGRARSQTHVSSAGSGQLCYTVVEGESNTLATLSPFELVDGPTPGSFKVRPLTLHAGSTGSFVLASPEGQHLAAAGVSGVMPDGQRAGAVPLRVFGGSGAFKGAVGAASLLIRWRPQPGSFVVTLQAVLYAQTAVAASWLSAGRRAGRTDNCVHPTLGPGEPTPLVLTFTTSSNNSVNAGTASNQLLASPVSGNATRYALQPDARFRYDSTVGSPSPTTFNESGRISMSGGGGFNFSSVVDGTSYEWAHNASFTVAFGSIAYAVVPGSGTGAFARSAGFMVDFFESFPDRSTFDIHVVAWLFGPIS